MIKPTWLLTAQEIFPMSDERYYQMYECAKRSAKIQLNRFNANTSPNYQRKYIENVGLNLLFYAARTLKFVHSFK